MLGLLFFKITQAQEKKDIVDSTAKGQTNDTVFTAITSAPGFDELGKYLSKSLHYPSYDLKNNVQGKVYLQFVVEADGSYLIL
jgi:outer membrane biosynthesis protein TonB